jgi:DNA-binding transcriptional regulator YiaG
MMYVFEAKKVRPATPSEESKIGMQGVKIFEGMVRTVIKADSRNEAWETANSKLAAYKEIGWIEETESKVKAHRIANSLSQSELSDKSGVSIRTLQKYECGDNDPSNAHAKIIVALASALGVDPKDII